MFYDDLLLSSNPSFIECPTVAPFVATRLGVKHIGGGRVFTTKPVSPTRRDNNFVFEYIFKYCTSFQSRKTKQNNIIYIFNTL